MPFTKHFALLALAALALPAAASTRIPLNGQWGFRPGGEGTPVESVLVPHTWGVGNHSTYLGTALYTKEFVLPAELRQKQVEIHFGGTFYKSKVWLNGVLLGEHEGGYTEYWFPISAHLKERNLLTVELNNEPGFDTIPGFAMRLASQDNIWYDWWHYGGIVRDVWLQVSDQVLIRRQQIRTKLEGGHAEVSAVVTIENNTSKPQSMDVVGELRPDGATAAIAQLTAKGTFPPGKSEVKLIAILDKPALWHFDHPNLYVLRTGLRDAKGSELDSIESTLGIRQIQIRDGRLYLNGEAVRLSGMTRHEESPWEGLAETRGTIWHDYKDMKSLQVVLTRPVHYPQHPDVLDFCDRNGILLIPEIPIWQFSEAQLKSPKVRALAKAMLTEMVTEAFNHPSILGWSMCNESETMKPGGVEYFREVYAAVKALDPDRYISYADDNVGFVKNPLDYAASHADFIMLNQYFGSWAGPADGLAPALERLHAAFPTKMVFISEFGFAGPWAPNAAAGDARRVEILKSQMEEFSKHPWIAGAIFWCYQDYRSTRNLWPGLEDGFVDMGIVDENRQRKPSYTAWKQRNEPVNLDIQWTGTWGAAPTGFKAAIGRRGANEIPSYELRGYSLEWEARDQKGTLLASGKKPLPVLGASISEEGTWKPPAGIQRTSLTFRVLRPAGYIAAERVVEWSDPAFGGMDIQSMKKAGIKVP